ncbi:hypothetical protein AB0I22_18235 [Streptomyces sp. NPDC050610]|uniref:hypothetical protein n=1 Tax=Streptomyces sp. NPDC050610 TaxID=3157097 RepID=UPI0034382709
MSQTQPRPSDQSGPEQQPADSGGKGRTIALAAGAVVVVAAIVGGIVLLSSGDGEAEDSASTAGATADSMKKYEGKRYRLTTPETVADGLKKKSGSETAHKGAFLSAFEKLGVSNPQSIGADYKGGKGIGTTWVKFTGVYGDVADPEKTVDRYFAQMASSADKSVASAESLKEEMEGIPTRVSPAGLDDDAVLKCQYVKYTSDKDVAAGRKGTSMPNCVWADHSTVGVLVHLLTAPSLSAKEPFDNVGEISAHIRADTRTEIK